MIHIFRRYDGATKNAFSLAEMLLVLLILSFLTVSLAPLAYKKIPKKTDRDTHGRFECYYEGNKLMQYTANEISGPQTPVEVEKCTFDPPAKASFFIIQAIGGGAGGTYITEDPNATTPIFESGTIKAPTSGGTYTQSNCIVSDSGSVGNKNDAEASCPTWLKTYWDSAPPSVTLSACASGGDGGVGAAKKYENGDVDRSTGGSGGRGDCTQFDVAAPMDIVFEYQGSISHSGGNITLNYPNGSCVLGGGTDGGYSSSPFVNGSSGGTGTSTCSPITGHTSGGSGRTGCFTNESCPPYSGGSGSFSLTDVDYKRQGTKGATRYGYMGNTGEYISMFFPGITESLDISVGKGGTAGASVANPKGGDGTATLIKLKDASNTEAIKAEGGKGKSLGGSYHFWYRGSSAPIDKGSVDASARFAVASGFSTFIELDEESNMPSKITGTMTGMGGDGAYSIVRDASSVEKIYVGGNFIKDEVYTSENKSQAYSCIDKRGNVLKTISGSETVCPAQPGNDGAVVIVW